MLNKIKIKLLTFSVIIVFIASVITCQAIYLNKKETLSKYNLSAVVDQNRLNGQMLFEYVNNTDSDVNELYFCLYPNAFKEEENIYNVAVKDRIDEAYPNGFDSGFLIVKKVLVNNREAVFSFEENEQILKVSTHSITANDGATVYIEFYTELPDSPMRFGFGESTYNFGNWYPVLCPTVNGEIIKNTYVASGDPFCSEVADYSVKITAPNDMRLAGSGQIIKKENTDPLKATWHIEGENIRDFAFVLSKNFKLKSKQIDGTIVYSYYIDNDRLGQFALDCAVSALKVFNEKFGKYPYPTLSIVAADFYIGGMEYPNIVLIDKNLYMSVKEEALEEVVVHEVAHQWWYGIVGNDEIKEPWLDEGLTQFSVGVYYSEVYGRERYNMFMQENEAYCKVIFKVMENLKLKFNKSIERSSRSFEHWLLYDAITYDVTALMLDTLCKTIGEEAFYSSLQLYFEENKYKIATKKAFISAFGKGAGKNISAIIEPWLKGNIHWG